MSRLQVLKECTIRKGKDEGQVIIGRINLKKITHTKGLIHNINYNLTKEFLLKAFVHMLTL